MNKVFQMLGLGGGSDCKELQDKFDAINRSQAVIEFDSTGTILDANENFLSVMDYRKDEIIGQHHSMFVEQELKQSNEYHQFWSDLGRGLSKTSEYRRLGKNGKEVWIHGSYNPLLDANGNVYKVVKFATDITEKKREETRNRKISEQAGALKQCQANVMLADNDLNIVYMNDTVTTMLKNNEADLKKELPSFSVEGLMGQSVDRFHVNPSHQRNLLANLSEPYRTDLKIGGMVFGLIASPWFDTQGKRIGTLVEWEDKTLEVKKQLEAEKIAAENSRIRQALDVADTSVMLADNDLNIIYMNNAVNSMLRERESELKKSIPGFNASTLMGRCVDDFHVNAKHQREMLKNLSQPYKTDIKVGDLTFGLIATPIYSDTGERLGTAVEWDDKTERLAKEQEEKRISEENARVKQALDNVSTNVMIADKDAHIIYLNEAVQGMMKNAESDIRKVLPNFNADKLNGVNMDIFHKDPSHQRNLVENLKSTYHGKAEVGGRSFTVIANPIVVEGERIGTVVEWSDRTAEVAIEKEIDAIVESASQGDFTKQISIEGKEGFFANLTSGLNELISTVEVALNDIIRMLGAMARGDLSERITRDYVGAFGQMKLDANTTADKLTEVITKIRTSSAAISSAANEIAQGNADLSQRTEEQASSLEETASSMEQMTSTVKQSSDNAQRANSLAADAQVKAQQGGEVVSRAVASMEEINRSSKRISDIISVIDEIAFQTNLLALNAAVEAARAGEQGRGFAVVAGEVRNLAQRSAAAAKEIKDLIRDSVTKVQDGSQLVNESGNTLSEIVSAVENVTSMMQEIADAAREQTSGIEQVNTAVSQMDEMTQQNAALVEEASAAGEALADQARSMNQVVDFFSVAHKNTEAAATKPAPQRESAPSVNTQSLSSGSLGGDDEWEDF